MFLAHRHKSRAVFLPGECGDCVETGDLLGRCLLPHISPWGPVVHPEPVERRDRREKIHYHQP